MCRTKLTQLFIVVTKLQSKARETTLFVPSWLYHRDVFARVLVGAYLRLGTGLDLKCPGGFTPYRAEVEKNLLNQSSLKRSSRK